MSPDEVIEELAGGRAAQGPEWKLSIVKLRGPFRAIFGAKVHENERPGSPRGIDHLRQEFVAARIDPVRVVDEDQEGLARAACLNEVSHERKEFALPRFGIHGRHEVVGVTHTEKVKDERYHLVEVRPGQRKRSGNLAPRFVSAVTVGNAEEVPEQLEQGQERDTLPDRRALRVGHQNATGPAARGELRTKPALPCTGGCHYPNDLPLTCCGLIERVLERGEFTLAPDEPRKPA